MRSLIEKKRDGYELSGEDWANVVARTAKDVVDEAPLAALLMACVLNGLSFEETVSLTQAIVGSGDLMRFSNVHNAFDKHSTGGVGDAASLIVVPLLAACDEYVAKLSGRALGHTGGTLDKLKSIPGLVVDLDPAAFERVVTDVGCCIAAQSAHFVPADRVLYALRDRTATVPSLGLIAASIVSKKIVAGAQFIVYDVKVGSGAFLKTLDEARKLAHTLVAVSERLGRVATAAITDMNQPLAGAAGEGLEVIAARDFLNGVDRPPRLTAVVEALLFGALRLRYDESAARSKVADVLGSARGLDKLERMIDAQGGDVDAFMRLTPAFAPDAARALYGGYLAKMDVPAIGNLVRELLARSGPMAGIAFKAALGDRVEAGEPVAHVFGGTRADVEALERCYSYSADPPEPLQSVYGRVDTSAGSASSTLSIK